MKFDTLGFKNLMAALVIAIAAIGCAGCQTIRDIKDETKDPVEDAAVAVDLAVEVKQQSYNFVLASPELPIAVQEGIGTANYTITELSRATGRAAAVYEGADAEIARLQSMGLDVPQATIAKSHVALNSLNRFLLEGLNPAIDSLKQIILDAKNKKDVEQSLRTFNEKFKANNFAVKEE